MVAKRTGVGSSIPNPTAPTMLPGVLVKSWAVVRPLKGTGADHVMGAAWRLAAQRQHPTEYAKEVKND